jgi:hypothetical protein
MMAARITEPRVHRPHRYFHGEREQEREEDPALFHERERQGLEARDAVIARLLVHVDERHEHEHRAQERVQEELQRRVHAPLAAPHADDEEHRDQHRFPEEIEQQRVHGGEHADHEPFHDEERGEVLRRALLDHGPARDDHGHGHERGQEDQRQCDAIDAERVVRVQLRDPGIALEELERAARGVEARVERNGQRERGQRNQQREPARGARVVIADQPRDEAARDRQPDEDGEK